MCSWWDRKKWRGEEWFQNERNSACCYIQALVPQGESKTESGIFAVGSGEGVAGLAEESISVRGSLEM